MLVLTRTAGEEVVMIPRTGERIRVLVLSVDRGGKTRLAFDAPPDCLILRREIEGDGPWTGGHSNDGDNG